MLGDQGRGAGQRRRHAADFRSRLQAGPRRARGRACGPHHPWPLRRDRRADPRRPADRPLPVRRLPAGQGQGAGRRDRRARRVRASLVFYESGPRLGESLAALAAGLGPREAAVVREISKLHEECVTGTLAELAARYADAPPKGEIVIVVGPPAEREAASDEELDAALREALASCRRRARRPRSPTRLGIPEEARLCPRAGAGGRVNRASKPSSAAAGARRLAAWWLRLQGWRILAQRARVPGGEVDLVARRGRTLAFVEVKARGSEEAARLGARRISAAPGRRRRRAAGAALRPRRRRHPHRRHVHRAAAAAAPPGQCLARVTSAARIA